MNPYLVDSNVVIDVITSDANFAEWSRGGLKRSAETGVLFINPLIFAEVCVGFPRREDAIGAMDALDFQYADLPWDAAFLAGRSFADYRRGGGSKRSPLPDFYIGAHTLLGGMTLLTRDATRNRSYFPKLKLVSLKPAS